MLGPSAFIMPSSRTLLVPPPHTDTKPPPHSLLPPPHLFPHLHTDPAWLSFIATFCPPFARTRALQHPPVSIAVPPPPKALSSSPSPAPYIPPPMCVLGPSALSCPHPRTLLIPHTDATPPPHSLRIPATLIPTPQMPPARIVWGECRGWGGGQCELGDGVAKQGGRALMPLLGSSHLCECKPTLA